MESNRASRDESGNLLVTDPVCEARIENIKTQVKSSERKVIGKVDVLSGKLDTFMSYHKDTIMANGKNIESLEEKTSDAEIQIERILQWKENGERRKDITLKGMTLAIGISVGSVGLLSNIHRIISFIVKVSAVKP